MKSLVSLGLFIFALSFCNLSERLSQIKGGNSNTQNSSANSTAGSPTNSTKTATSDETVEKPRLTEQQQFVFDKGQEVKWDEQGIAWKLPTDWKKMNVSKEMFNYSSPDLAFLIANISVMPDNFPSEISLKATYESALQQLKNGKYERARYLEIDGVKGVEFVETMPEDKSGARRHQWIAFRNYLGQTQQLNIMLSTKGTNFEKHRDDFPAVLYSMKIAK